MSRDLVSHDLVSHDHASRVSENWPMHEIHAETASLHIRAKDLSKTSFFGLILSGAYVIYKYIHIQYKYIHIQYVFIPPQKLSNYGRYTGETWGEAYATRAQIRKMQSNSAVPFYFLPGAIDLYVAKRRRSVFYVFILMCCCVPNGPNIGVAHGKETNKIDKHPTTTMNPVSSF